MSIKCLFFRKHSWSISINKGDRHVQRCYDCGVEREYQNPTTLSESLQRRMELARAELARLKSAAADEQTGVVIAINSKTAA